MKIKYKVRSLGKANMVWKKKHTLYDYIQEVTP